MILKKGQKTLDMVQDFYNKNPFPDFDINKYSSREDFNEHIGWYYKLLDLYIPQNEKIGDIGCGTGQFACYLAMRGRHVTGVDFSKHAISKAEELRNKLAITTVYFKRLNLFELDLPDRSFAYTFCNGVLHHTPDPYRGFTELVRITQCCGYIIIGLYNTYGRMIFNLRKLIFKRRLKIDEKLKQNLIKKIVGTGESDEKKLKSWFYDQCMNPHETTHTIGEVMKWFRKNNVSYVSSIPDIKVLGKKFDQHHIRLNSNPFHSKTSKWPNGFANLLKQFIWMFTQKDTGGYFVMIGKKEC
jgi:ubiquinone/menaquinone biosynthesis C-methylase UbiE